jgi:hypothetical protein
MADHAEARNQPRSAQRFRRQSQDAFDQADVVLGALNEAATTTLQAAAEDEGAAKTEATG